MRKAVVFAIGAAVAASSATASPETDALKATGLAGKWAFDCTKHETSSDYQTWTATADGHVEMTTHAAKGRSLSHTLTAFKSLSESRVALSFETADGQSDVLLHVEKNRYRMWSSTATRAVDTQNPKAGVYEVVFVRNGTVAIHGLETRWYNRCED